MNKLIIAKVLQCLIFLFVINIGMKAQDTVTFKNPILRGFYPDPSISRVGDDYYMVNSSFEWFPGVPIFHSKDLVNWKQIGHVLDRPEQLDLVEGLKPSKGIYAPTIHFHDGKFYMITTNVDGIGNFYVTADKPGGPWSNPVILDAPGFDPSIFWDDDGKVWYVGAYNISGKREWEGQNGIFVQPLNLETGKLYGKPTQITFGHATNAVWGEGPHIYKIDGRYLLLIAEGGTSFQHAITVFECDSVNGKYTPSQVNPVLTHRNLGFDYPIFAVGHADIVQTQNDEWWAVLLAIRSCDGKNLLGRETFLVPLEFDNGWPVFNRGIGKVRFEEKRPNLPWTPIENYPVRDEFVTKDLAMKWVFLRTPKEKWYEIKNGKIILDTRPQSMTKLEQPSLIAQRITEFSFESFTKVDFNPKSDNEEAGFIAMYNNERNFRLVKTLEKGMPVVKLYRVKLGEEKLVATEYVEEESMVLGLKANKLDYQFYYGKDKQSLKPIGEKQDATVNASQSGLDFTGPMIGFYTSSNGQQSNNKAVFDWFEYKTY